MEQIRESQITPNRDLQPNPYVAPPRDLRLNTDGKDVLANIRPAVQENVGHSDTTSAGSDEGVGSIPLPPGINYGDGLNDAVQLPAVPHIISVKEQIVNIHDDGTITIDV